MTPTSLDAMRKEYRRLRERYCSLLGCTKEEFEARIREQMVLQKNEAHPVDYVRKARCLVETARNSKRHVFQKKIMEKESV